VPYWRLSAFYFFYFALLGAYIPYWALFLQGEGFSALQIGYLTGIVMATKVVAPSIWGYLGDSSGRRMQIIRLGALLALLLFCGIFVNRSFAWLALVVVGYSFFWNAILPQFEVITLVHLGQSHNRYGQVRVWGSVGFIGAVVLLGWLFDLLPVSALPFVMALLLAGIWLCSLLVPEAAKKAQRSDASGLWQLLRRDTVWGFFLVCFLLQVAHGPYYTFFSVYLEDLSYNRSLIGQLWALGVLAEVILFMFTHRLLPRHGIRRLLLVSLALTILRWLLIGYLAEHLLVLLFAQCLHAASFGAFHAIAIEMIRREFPAELAGQGQAIYSGVSFGAGGAVGAVASGYLWEYSAQMSYLLASAATLLALVLAWRTIRYDE
jgi:PPP family 3-phenylpropionic acid transporter